MEKRIADLKAGDIVKAHGGTFRVLTDAAQSEGHRDSYWDGARRIHEPHPGPVDCAIAQELLARTAPALTWTVQRAPDGKRWEVIKVGALELAGTFFSRDEAEARALFLIKGAQP